jgi:hypothetical protein
MQTKLFQNEEEEESKRASCQQQQFCVHFIRGMACQGMMKETILGCHPPTPRIAN